MTETTNLNQFIKDFDIIDNALKMRQLIRWNGRDVMKPENLAEHTHLVVACVMYIVKECKEKYHIPLSRDTEHTCMRLAMIHDSLELFRGDILSTTKDAIPGLRNLVDEEEVIFMKSQQNFVTDCEWSILSLADMMACYKFLERELRYPNNDFVKDVYITCKNKFDKCYDFFLTDYSERYARNKNSPIKGFAPFQKGYLEDAGVDIILNEPVIFLPMGTQSVDLKVHITPNEGEMAFVCARTSAAAKGLVIATCPIDPNFTGTVTAIVHNVSNDIVKYRSGESFCQYVTCKIITNTEVPVKKSGKRSTSKLGGTDVSSN